MIEVRQSEEEQLLRDTVVTFVESACPRSSVRELLGRCRDCLRATPGRSAVWVAELAGAGVRRVGITATWVSFSAIVAEERGRNLQPGPFIPMSVVIGALCRSGSDDQRATVLQLSVLGEKLAYVAVAVANGNFAPQSALHFWADGRELVLWVRRWSKMRVRLTGSW